MKDDIKDILYLFGVAVVLYFLSITPVFQIFSVILKYGMKIGAYLFIIFAIASTIRIVKENIFNNKKQQQ
jgi:hypothetical protein